MKKYILFDFDGTLADAAKVYVDAWNAFAETYGYLPLTLEEWQGLKHLNHFEKAEKYRFPVEQLSSILPDIHQYFNEHLHEVKLFDGVKEMLETLFLKGYTIVIVSSNQKENIERILERENIDVVSEVVSVHNLFGKDAAIMQLMEDHHLTPQEMLYVGDELRDIEACNKIGVPFMWVSWGMDGFELIEKEKPAYVAHTPEDIIEQLDNLTMV